MTLEVRVVRLARTVIAGGWVDQHPGASTASSLLSAWRRGATPSSGIRLRSRPPGEDEACHLTECAVWRGEPTVGAGVELQR